MKVWSTPMKSVGWCVLMYAIFSGCSSGQTATNGSSDSLETIAANLTVPWGIDFLPDGRIILAERTGAVKIVSDGAVSTVGEITVADNGEAGLLGLAVDPQFAQSQAVYVYYTYGTGNLLNRVSRFFLGESLENETVLLDSIPGASIHDGGRLHFGPDGYLYITTGDAGNPTLSGNRESLAGKILRIAKDGTIPPDNPHNGPVYASGLRNPQGLAWHQDQLYAVDHGPSRRDRIVQIEAGQDYGWPRTCEEVPAFRCYTDFTLAPAGAAIVGNTLYVTGLRGNQLRAIDLNSGNERELFTDLGRLRTVVVHQGYLYLSTSNRDGRGDPGSEDDRLLRISVDALR